MPQASTPRCRSRAAASICYSAGQFGGVRAAMALRVSLAEMGMPSIPSECPIPHIGTALDEDGHAQNEHVTRTLNRFLDEFFWYARALQRERRNGTPY
ncbi:MAG: NADPH-dependent FMN reductase [Rhodanobacter sp.]